MPKITGVRADDLVHAAADLILGGRCAGCGRPWLGACPACVRAVVAAVPFCVSDVPGDLPAVFAGGAYDAQLRCLLLAAKERSALGLVPLLGERLAAAVAAWALQDGRADPVELVPVPTAPARVAERGLDFTAALAGAAARHLRDAGLPARSRRGLRLVRRPRDQSELGREGRLANLGGAFAVVGGNPTGRVVVVDDIVTTGATLREAVRALTSAGRPPVAAAVVAATVRWSAAR